MTMTERDMARADYDRQIFDDEQAERAHNLSKTKPEFRNLMTVRPDSHGHTFHLDADKRPVALSDESGEVLGIRPESALYQSGTGRYDIVLEGRYHAFTTVSRISARFLAKWHEITSLDPLMSEELNKLRKEAIA